jgi:hypothetical protein
MMDSQTTKIITTKCVDKRQTQRKSTNMERFGFCQALDEADAEAGRVGASIEEVVTDAHIGIAAEMSRFCCCFGCCVCYFTTMLTLGL